MHAVVSIFLETLDYLSPESCTPPMVEQLKPKQLASKNHLG
jgi:hypothetical protein